MDSIIPSGDTPLKQCSKCYAIYPATPEFFGRDKTKRDGLYSSCRACSKAQGKLWRDAHPDYLKQYYQQHRQEQNEQCRYYNAIHKEEIQEQRKQYRQAHKEEIRVRNKACRDAHGEKYREHKRRWGKTEHGRTIKRALEQKRLALKKTIEGTLTAEQIQEKLKAQHYRCYYAACGHARFKKDKNGVYIYQIEHTIPVSRTEANPRHDVNYVVLSCPMCNMKKQDKLPHEWEEGGRLF